MEMRTDPAVEQELRGLFAQWLAALPRHDLAFYERTIADEWVYTDVSGTVRSKADYLELVPSLIAPDHQGELLEYSARLYGDDVALVTGRYTSYGKLLSGIDYDQDSRFTGLWVRRDGRWQCAAHQAGNILPPPY